MVPSDSHLVYKVCAASEWRDATVASVYRGSTVDLRDGFIHFSTAAQLAETLRRHFAGQRDLVLVAVDPGGLGAQLRWEPSRGGDLFPHLYGDLPVSLAQQVTPLDVEADGRPRLRQAGFSVIGLGGGPLGEASLAAAEAERLVGAALDLGVTVLDTARSYGDSEVRLGRALGARRSEVVVVTKGGYGIAGVPDWTGEAVRRGVDEALGRLGTDVIDVFLLHSCGLATLERGEVVEALLRARDAGKVREVGYSGEGDALAWAAARREAFSVIECSLSPFDQRNLPLVAAARAKSFCVLAKRPLGNAPWRHATRPAREDVATYWDRHRAMAFDPSPLSWDVLSIRFSAFQPGVTTALVGTSNPTHLAAAVDAAKAGPLDEATATALRAAFDAHGAAWPGVV